MSELRAVLVSAEHSDCAAAASCMYSQNPYPKQQMPYEMYEQLITEDCEGAATWIVLDEYDRAYAWLVFDIGYDPHFPGRGATVHYLLVDQNRPEALRVLMRTFLKYVKGTRCAWYQTSKRLDERTIVSEYKRIT